MTASKWTRPLGAALILFSLSVVAQSDDGADIDRIASQSQIEDLANGLGIAPGSAPRPLNDLSVKLIKYYEGWRKDAYNDVVGYCTIGYGHLIALKTCKEVVLGEFQNDISLGRGDEILERDTWTARLAVSDLVTTELTDAQFGALSSFVFNAGKGNFRNSTILKLVNIGEIDAAAVQFRRWVMAGGKVVKGLANRRKCEEALFRGELSLNSSGLFSPFGCQVPLGVAVQVGDPIDLTKGE